MTFEKVTDMTDDRKQPTKNMAKILVVIPCLNEQEHIGDILNAITQEADACDYHIVTVDGGSTDGTLNIVQSFVERHPAMTLIHNEKKLQSAGINKAVALYGEHADFLIRVDAHCAYPPDYCRKLLLTQKKTQADSVVVRMVARGKSYFQYAVSAAQNSALGNGGSAHRKPGDGQDVDHGHHALMRLSAFKAIGGYDETFSHNEDAEYDTRLKKAGFRIWLMGGLPILYYPRKTSRSLFKQYFNYGSGRAKTMFKHRAIPKLRQSVPLGIAPAVALALLYPFNMVFPIPALTWAVACLSYGVLLGVKQKSIWAACSGFPGMIMHFGWSCGFLSKAMQIVFRSLSIGSKPRFRHIVTHSVVLIIAIVFPSIIGATLDGKASTAISNNLVVQPIIELAKDMVHRDDGIKTDAKSSRIFVIKANNPSCDIRNFKADDKIRLLGFGFTKPSDLEPYLRDEQNAVILALPNGQKVRLIDVKKAELTNLNWQLELDRNNLKETFKDDFNVLNWYAEGRDPKTDKTGVWRTNYGWGPAEAEASRSLPGEAQVYADLAFKGTSQSAFGLDPFRINRGILEITATPASDQVRPYIWGRSYISGLITTKYSFSQTYGVFEIRAKLPKGAGFWPAFWLLPSDSSWPPEIDVFEFLGKDPTRLYFSEHSKTDNQHISTSYEFDAPDLTADFHNYTVEWNANDIIWYFDNVEMARKPTPKDMHKPMYMLANLAVGAPWPGLPNASTQFPGIYAIDWIRTSKREPAKIELSEQNH